MDMNPQKKKAFDADKVIQAVKMRIKDQENVIDIASAKREELKSLLNELEGQGNSGYMVLKEQP